MLARGMAIWTACSGVGVMWIDAAAKWLKGGPYTMRLWPIERRSVAMVVRAYKLAASGAGMRTKCGAVSCPMGTKLQE